MTDRPTRIERQAYKWVLKMLDDPGRHAAALERWLSKDDEHRVVYKRVAIEVGRASDAAATSPALRASSRPLEQTSAWRTKGRTVAIGGLVAVSLAVASVFGLLRTSVDNGGAGIFRPAPGHAYAAGASDQSVRLEDASVVTLFAHSRLETSFSNSERSVRLLNGRARFAVAHNTARPFVVYAAGGKVTATGTLFEVAIDGGVKVRLISGSIEVSYPRAVRDTPQKVARLQPGEEASYPAPGASPTALATPASSTSSTRATESFDDVPAAEIVARVNRSSAVKIDFADPAVSTRKIVADLDISDADAVAQKLAILLGLVIDRSHAGRLVLKTAY